MNDLIRRFFGGRTAVNHVHAHNMSTRWILPDMRDDKKDIYALDKMIDLYFRNGDGDRRWDGRWDGRRNGDGNK